jgi:hypothetical protein
MKIERWWWGELMDWVASFSEGRGRSSHDNLLGARNWPDREPRSEEQGPPPEERAPGRIHVHVCLTRVERAERVFFLRYRKMELCLIPRTRRKLSQIRVVWGAGVICNAEGGRRVAAVWNTWETDGTKEKKKKKYLWRRTWEPAKPVGHLRPRTTPEST